MTGASPQRCRPSRARPAGRGDRPACGICWRAPLGVREAGRGRHRQQERCRVGETPGQGERETAALTVEQVQTLFDHLEETGDQLEYLHHLAAQTRLRRGNCQGCGGVASTWTRAHSPSPSSGVHSDAGAVVADTKTDAGRRVLPIPSTLLPVLKRAKKSSAAPPFSGMPNAAFTQRHSKDDDVTSTAFAVTRRPPNALTHETTGSDHPAGARGTSPVCAISRMTSATSVLMPASAS